MIDRPIGLVILDNDGVLVDSESIACAVLAEILTENGLLTTSEEVVANYLGGSLSRTRKLAEDQLQPNGQ